MGRALAATENRVPLLEPISGAFAGKHQSRPNHYQDYAEGRRNLLIVFCSDADVRIAHADAVMFGMRKRNEK